MKTYRYKVVKNPKELLEAKLNEFGRRGFELTGVLSDQYGYTYYFKQEIKEWFMKFIHTFWSKPLLLKRFRESDKEVILYNYACSVASVKHFGHNIEWYTEEYGKELLGYLPYDNIHIIDNVKNDNIA